MSARKSPSITQLLSLLPALRERGVQPIGRLDEDTTGLLLLTDDGLLIHKLHLAQAPCARSMKRAAA